MKKLLVSGIVIVVAAVCLIVGFRALAGGKAQICLNKQPNNFIGCTLAGPVALSVQVTGSVDQVSFYEAVNDGNLVATITTDGKDTTEILYLPTYSRYYFVVKKGDQTFANKPVGFDTNQTSAKLMIRGLDQWEGW